jgi:hypothetical protein
MSSGELLPTDIELDILWFYLDVFQHQAFLWTFFDDISGGAVAVDFNFTSCSEQCFRFLFLCSCVAVFGNDVAHSFSHRSLLLKSYLLLTHVDEPLYYHVDGILFICDICIPGMFRSQYYITLLR